MSAGRERVRVQGLEIPVGEIIGLVRWFPSAGEWQHELIAGPLHGVDEAGRVILNTDDGPAAYDADVWSVCAAVPEPLRSPVS